jgi:hypothetical protein
MTGARRAWCRRPTWLVVALLLGSLGCGQREVVMEVDLLSFLAAGETVERHYDLPAGTVLGDPQTIEPRTIELVQGLDEVVQVASVELSVELRFANQSGSGTARVKLYATGDRGEGFPFVYDTAPVAELVVGLGHGNIIERTAVVHSAGTPTLIPTFESRSLVLGLAVFMDALGSEEPLTGAWSLTRLGALVTGDGHLQP